MKLHEILFLIVALGLLGGLGYVIYDQFIKEDPTTTEVPLAAGGGSDVTTASNSDDTTTPGTDGDATTTGAAGDGAPAEGSETTTVPAADATTVTTSTPVAQKQMNFKQMTGFYVALGIMFIGAATSNAIYFLGSRNPAIIRIFSTVLWLGGLTLASVMATKFGATWRQWAIYAGAIGLSVLAFPRARILILGPAYAGFKGAVIGGKAGVKGGGLLGRLTDVVSGSLLIGKTDMEKLMSSTGDDLQDLRDKFNAAKTIAEKDAILDEFIDKVAGKSLAGKARHYVFR